MVTDESSGKKLIEFADFAEEQGFPTVLSQGARIYGEAMQDKSTLGGLDFFLKLIELGCTEIKKTLPPVAE
jgi:hypothetical protein